MQVVQIVSSNYGSHASTYVYKYTTELQRQCVDLSALHKWVNRVLTDTDSVAQIIFAERSFSQAAGCRNHTAAVNYRTRINTSPSSSTATDQVMVHEK